jgi:hypothetical protein
VLDDGNVNLEPETLAGEPGDSIEQRQAETVMISLLSARLGFDLQPKRISLPDGGRLELDGHSSLPMVACEAWAHLGRAKSAQMDKVAKDILKLMFVQGLLGDQTRLILLFCDEAAAQLLRGRSWRAQARRTLGIEIEVVDPPLEVREKIAKGKRGSIGKPSVLRVGVGRWSMTRDSFARAF